VVTWRWCAAGQVGPVVHLCAGKARRNQLLPCPSGRGAGDNTPLADELMCALVEDPEKGSHVPDGEAACSQLTAESANHTRVYGVFSGNARQRRAGQIPRLWRTARKRWSR
jgi:hypothetical protein